MKTSKFIKSISLILIIALLGVSLSATAINSSLAELDNKQILTWQDKITPELFEVMEKATDDEKIPVYFWYTDIDHEKVKQEVERRTGLNEGNIAVDYEMPDNEVLNAIAEMGLDPGERMSLYDDEYIKDEMEKWLERTENHRNLENAKTDLYIDTKRAISREEYGAKSSVIIQELRLNEEDITFNSQYAPTMILNMTSLEIKRIANNININSIGCHIDVPVELPTIDSVKETVSLNRVYSKTGLNGNNVKIGMFEIGFPEADTSLNFNKIINVGNVATHGHANNTARVLMQNSQGISQGITLYSTNADFVNIESMLSSGIKALNVSFGWVYNTGNYEYYDKWFDHVASQHNVSYVCSTGNDANVKILSPAMGYNSIAVNGYTDNNTGNNKTDDTLNMGGGYSNGFSYLVNNGCYKPDIVAPASAWGGGTSTSAPIVTGTIALMLQLKPSLGAQPQAIKAIILASSHRKVKDTNGTYTETMAQGLTNKQGVGAFDAFTAISIVARGQYGVREFTGTEDNIRFFQPAYESTGFNVSIAWLQENTISGNHATGNLTVGTIQDVDLYLFRDSTQIGSSLKGNSSTEMVYATTSSSVSSNYRIRVYRYSNNSLNIRYGYAWSTNAQRFEPSTMSGLYYIKNQATGHYLNLNTSNRQLTQTAFSGGTNQQWIFGGGSIKTANTATPGGIGNGATASGSIKYADVLQNGFLTTLGFSSQNDGSYNIRNYTSTYGGLQPYNSSNLTGARMAFHLISNTDKYQNWYLESVNYDRGDLNCDGVVGSADQLMLKQYLLGIITLTDVQLHLADINCDGVVGAADLLLLQNRLLGID